MNNLFCNPRATCLVGRVAAFMAISMFSLADTSAQTVSNVRAQVSQDNAGAVIAYDLDSPAGPALVNVYYTLDDGATFRAVSGGLVGDVGASVSAGLNKIIQWPDMGVALHAYHGSQIKFRVAAQPGSLPYHIQFDTDMTTATEGQGTVKIPVRAVNDYFGKIRYTVGAMTNVTTGTVSGDIFPLSGEVQMIAGEAEIEVTIHDDMVIEDPKTLALDLEFDESLGYDLGATFRHMVILHDNDGYWNGVMMGNKTSDGEASFRMAILQSGNSFEGNLISAGTTGGLSTFPPGEWPLNISYDGTKFTATTRASMPVPATSMFPNATAMQRNVTFVADTSTTGIYKANVLIGGEFKDEMQGSGTSAYLGSVTVGGFALLRELSAFQPPDPPVIPISEVLPNGAPQPVGVLNSSQGVTE